MTHNAKISGTHKPALSAQYFVTLCAAFYMASEEVMESIERDRDRWAQDAELLDNNEDRLKAVEMIGYRHIAKTIKSMAVRYAWQQAARLPGSIGRHYAGRLENYTGPLSPACQEAERAAALQFAYGLHPMRIAGLMPKAMKSPEALAYAKAWGLGDLARAIEWNMPAPLYDEPALLKSA